MDVHAEIHSNSGDREGKSEQKFGYVDQVL